MQSGPISYFCEELPQQSGEFTRVAELFRKTMPADKATLIRIERVENPEHVEKYELQKGQMRRRNADYERELFHGTKPATVQKICKENFDPRLSGENGTAYGQGSYFAVNASYSDQYANHNQSGGSRFMFLANVLVGSYTKGHSNMRKPPLKHPDDCESDRFDSCVNDVRDPTIFVIFERSQCYPTYLVEYSTRSELPSLRRVPSGMSSVFAFRNRNAVFPLPDSGLQRTCDAGFELGQVQPSTSAGMSGETHTYTQNVLPPIPSSPTLRAVPSAPPPTPPSQHDTSDGIHGNATSPRAKGCSRCDKLRYCCCVFFILVILAAAYLVVHIFVVDKVMNTNRLKL